MRNFKIHPFIIVALGINSLVMAMYAYRNFRTEETGYGIVFTFLCIFFLGLVIDGLFRNWKTGKKANKEIY